MPNVDLNIIINSSEKGIESYSDGGQENATQLTKTINRVDINDENNGSVKAFHLQENEKITIQNNTENDLDIFPFDDDNIFGQAQNTPYTIVGGQQITFFCYQGEEGTITII